MTEKQRAFRNSLLTKIHTHSFYKGAIQNLAWEEFLKNSFGVESSKFLSIKELISLIDLMDGKEVNLNKPDYKGRRAINSEISTKKQIVKALSLKDELGWSNGKWRTFVLKYTDKMLWNDKMINSLTKKELTTIISIMQKIKSWREKN
ncbi:DUF1018 domain-containing protein [Campylobacter sp. FMV-PI01]|uniref:DUF1018 domain-containing protein n=1 Tax=Campylobacter portucalensis TaxID=2608384 RepID=A0A6L5WGY2_9BACT|nr:DUF1018 domain-containing protein [Campylobacter portucalensis]MSN96448.1 DUF1018 domain-containing protein [Campylobacter portucalensis]